MNVLLYCILICIIASCTRRDEAPSILPDVPPPLPPGEEPEIPKAPPNIPGDVSFARFEADQLETLSRLNNNDRLNTRFISLCEQTNQGKPPKNYVDGINKGINSVSSERNIATGRISGECMQAIDLRDYGLTRVDWDVIVARNPFGRTFESFTSRGQLVKQLVQERQPWMPGHTFLFTIFDANVYPFLLRLPNTLAQLQIDLGVNLQRLFDQEDDETFLFGHTQSPISIGKPRLHLRTESTDGFYYQSYDVVIANIGRDEKNIFQSPFPIEARSANTLLPDGHEVIFSLPNRMIGFYLAGGDGAFQQFAPLDLVVDTESSARALDPTIRYLACNRCHTNGLIERQDEVFDKVRNDNSFGNADFQKSAFWHGRGRELSDVLRDDNQTIRDAVQRAGVGSAEVDPINFYTDKIRQESNLEQVAALMFMTPGEFDRALRGTVTSLNQIGSVLNGDTISFEQLRETLPIFVIEANIFRDNFGE